MIVDMHCHLDLYPDPSDVASKCIERGAYVLSVTTTPKAFLGTFKLERIQGRIRTALGLHPQLAHLRYGELELFDSLLPRAKFVGEIGLDGSKEYAKYYSLQLKVFRHILASTQRQGGRVMSLHSRSSATDVLDELVKFPNLGIPILHWFTGDSFELKRAIDIGCWFSVGPAMIKSKKGAHIASLIPKNRFLTETDGPFGAVKGEKLMPWDAPTVLPTLAKIWNLDLEDVENLLQTNFKNLMVAT